MNFDLDFIIQASTRSWAGGKDNCMNLVNGVPVVIHTIKKIIQEFPNSKVILASPMFDNELDNWKEIFFQFDLSIPIYCGDDGSPIKRILQAAHLYGRGSYLCRIDGLNMFSLIEDFSRMHALAIKNNLDCLKFPDSFPPQLTCDIYNLNALKRTLEELPVNSPFAIHPKYWMFSNQDRYRCEYYTSFTNPSDSYLQNAREISKNIYRDHRIEITDKEIAIGNMLSFHYELALPYIKTTDVVLDIACGDGAGTKKLADRAYKVIGSDIDNEIIIHAQSSHIRDNLSFCKNDVNHLSTYYEEHTFDVVTSFETIEHVEIPLYLEQIYRVLKKGGLFILSTPQNILGHLPLCSQHNIEFSKEQLNNLVSSRFKVEKFISIKQGRIILDDNNGGSNSVVIARKE